MVVETMKTQNLSLFYPGGIFGIGLVAGLVVGFAVLLIAA